MVQVTVGEVTVVQVTLGEGNRDRSPSIGKGEQNPIVVQFLRQIRAFYANVHTAKPAQYYTYSKHSNRIIARDQAKIIKDKEKPLIDAVMESARKKEISLDDRTYLLDEIRGTTSIIIDKHINEGKGLQVIS